MLRAPFVLIWNLLRLLAFGVRVGIAKLFYRPDSRPVLARVTVPESLPLRVSKSLLSRLSSSPSPDAFEWHEQLRELVDEPRVAGVVFEVRAFAGGLARVESLRRLIETLRAAGKRVVVYSQEGLDALQFTLATAADDVVIAPPAQLGYFRLSVAPQFYREAFEKIGIRAQFVHIGDYKTAGHRFIHGDITGPQRENLEALLNARRAHLGELIASRPGMGPDAIDALFDRGLFSAEAAAGRRLVDHVAYDDRLSHALNSADTPETRPRVRPLDRVSRTPRYRWTPLRRRPPVIAVLDCSGVIVMGSEGGGVRALRQRTDLVSYREAIRDLRRSKDVQAVVVAVDSPGGSALASDLLWRELRRLADAVPVVAALRSVAASGGYYLAVACDHIIAQRATLVGSIGVVAGKFTLDRLLARAGIRQRRIDHGRLIHHDDPFEPLDPEELAALRSSARGMYRRFVDRVAQGRPLSRAEVHALGQGRVYTGDEALSLRLVDALGDLDDAIAEASRRAELSEEPEVVVYPQSRRGLRAVFGRGSASALDGVASTLDAAASFLGVEDGAAREALALRTLFEREQVLAWGGFREVIG